jgi:ankyrin repeat protein
VNGTIRERVTTQLALLSLQPHSRVSASQATGGLGSPGHGRPVVVVVAGSGLDLPFPITLEDLPPMRLPTFSPTFYQAYRNKRPGSPVQDSHTPAPVLFTNPQYHGQLIEQFMASPDFARCLEQYAALVDGLVHFVEQHAQRLPQPLSETGVTAIKDVLGQFKNNTLDLVRDFYGPHKPLIYGTVKEILHELESWLKNDKIPLQKRINVIQAMAPHMGACTGGILTALQAAITDLKCSYGGIKGAAHLMKIKMVDNLIAEYMRTTPDYYIGNEVHLANVYFNFLAGDLGLKTRSDPNLPSSRQEIPPQQLAACRKKVLALLKPSTLATIMADDYLGRLNGALAEKNLSIFKTLEGDHLTQAHALTQNLQRATLNSEYGAVPMDLLLVPAPGDGYGYRFPHATQVARHFMEALKRSELINYDDTVCLTKGGAGEGSIMQLGNLFWIDKDGECEELKVPHLLAASPHAIAKNLEADHVAAQEQGELLEHIAWHVLDNSEAEQLQDIPEKWLNELAKLFVQHQPAQDQDWSAPVVLLAAAGNRTKILTALLDAGADGNAQSSNGTTAVMLAAESGHAAALHVLLKEGANKEAKNGRGLTAVMLAAEKDHADALHVLLKEGANKEAVTPSGFTATMIAAYCGHAAALRVLINAGVDMNAANPEGFTATMLAAQNGHAEALRVLAENGADMDATNTEGVTATMLAVAKGHAAALRELIKAKADIDAATLSGVTATMIAAENGHTDALRELINAGADMDAENIDGFTALMLAAKNGHTEAVQALIKAKMSIPAQNTSGATADLLATQNGQTEALRALLDAKNKNGNTAVMLAAQHGQIETLRELINAGADVNATNTHGVTAAMYAAYCGHTDALQELIKAKADINAKSVLGNTAIMLAAQKGHIDVLLLLLQNGADTDAKNNLGMTAAMIAAKHRQAAALQVLMQHSNVSRRTDAPPPT